MNLKKNKNELVIKVYYEDTDAAGIVYHSKYLNFAERGRTEFLRGIGFYQSQLHKKEKIRFVVKSLKIDYKDYSELDDTLKVNTYIKLANRAKIIFIQKVLKKGKTITSLEVMVCCIRENGRVARMPIELYNNLIKG